MLSWMLRARELQAFVAKHGGSEDQLFGGQPENANDVSQHQDSHRSRPQRLRLHARSRWRTTNSISQTNAGGSRHTTQTGRASLAAHMGSGHREAMIMEAAHGSVPDVNAVTARVVCQLLRNCATYQFHDTSENAPIKMRWGHQRPMAPTEPWWQSRCRPLPTTAGGCPPLRDDLPSDPARFASPLSVST